MSQPDLAPQTLGEQLRCWAREAGRYVRAVMGADAYDRYLERHARLHPGEPAMSERQFWREHQDWQDDHPQGRCC